MNYTVCITTYNKRFDLFKNVFEKVKKQREDVEFIVLANGLSNLPFDEEYRKKIIEFIAPYKNTFPIIFPEFRSLSKLWNTGCQLATNNNVLVISDDIDIEDNFFDEYEEALLKYPNDCFCINNNFCGFHINRKILDKLNWFDERFLSLGSEDLWFLESHQAVMGYYMPSVEMKSYHNEFKLDWQKELRKKEMEEGLRMENQNHNGMEHSPFNYEVFKYLMTARNIFDREEYPPFVKQYPHEKFFWDYKNTY